MTREFENQVLDGVAFNRRGLVRKALVGGAFVVPAIVYSPAARGTRRTGAA